MRTAVAAEDGDEFCLLESLKDRLSARFVGVAEKELVVPEGGVGGEGLDENPGLLWRPFSGGAVDVEDVHFQDL